MNEVRQFFGYENAAQFRKDWVALTPEDKEQLKKGIQDGSLNY
jgi:hypothetical protein